MNTPELIAIFAALDATREHLTSALDALPDSPAFGTLRGRIAALVQAADEAHLTQRKRLRPHLPWLDEPGFNQGKFFVWLGKAAASPSKRKRKKSRLLLGAVTVH